MYKNVKCSKCELLFRSCFLDRSDFWPSSLDTLFCFLRIRIFFSYILTLFWNSFSKAHVKTCWAFAPQKIKSYPMPTANLESPVNPTFIFWTVGEAGTGLMCSTFILKDFSWSVSWNWDLLRDRSANLYTTVPSNVSQVLFNIKPNILLTSQWKYTVKVCDLFLF